MMGTTTGVRQSGSDRARTVATPTAAKTTSSAASTLLIDWPGSCIRGRDPSNGAITTSAEIPTNAVDDTRSADWFDVRAMVDRGRVGTLSGKCARASRATVSSGRNGFVSEKMRSTPATVTTRGHPSGFLRRRSKNLATARRLTQLEGTQGAWADEHANSVGLTRIFTDRRSRPSPCR